MTNNFDAFTSGVIFPGGNRGAVEECSMTVFPPCSRVDELFYNFHINIFVVCGTVKYAHTFSWVLCKFSYLFKQK